MSARKVVVANSLVAMFACCLSGMSAGCGDDNSSGGNTESDANPDGDGNEDSGNTDTGNTDADTPDAPANRTPECAVTETVCGTQCCSVNQRCEANACVGKPFIAAGGMHTCAVSSTGRAKCWGYNEYGQLGFAAGVFGVNIPVQVAGEELGVVFLAGGALSTCAIRVDGEVRCWGNNEYGQLGVGVDKAEIWYSRPVIGLPPEKIVAIAPGAFHTCALTAIGDVYCWGVNMQGQLGDGTFINREIPTRVIGIRSPAIAISSGLYTTCVITSDKRVSCWGAGAVGSVDFQERTCATPVHDLDHDVAAISVYGMSACALTSDGKVYCWGMNNRGQLGNGNHEDQVSAVPVEGLPGGIKSVSLGAAHACVVTSTKGVMCWGYNDSGQLGDGTNDDTDTPKPTLNLTGVESVTAGLMHTCALLETGEAKCWGQNTFGQLGNGDNDNRNTPVAVNQFPWDN